MSAFTENVRVVNETATSVSKGFTVYSNAINEQAIRLNRGMSVNMTATNENIVVVHKGFTVAVFVSNEPVSGFANKTDVRTVAIPAVTVIGEAAKSVIVGEVPVINAIRAMQYRRSCLASSDTVATPSSSDGKIGNSKFYR